MHLVQIEIAIESPSGCAASQKERRPPGRIVPFRAEMQGRTEFFDPDVATVPVAQITITARFHQINFTRSRPPAVHATRRHKPQGYWRKETTSVLWGTFVFICGKPTGPQPIAGRQFRSNLNNAKLETERLMRQHQSTLDWWCRMIWGTIVFAAR